MSRLGLAPFDVEGQQFSSSEVLQALLPLLTAARMSKINQVVQRRCWSVTPVLENIYDRGNISAVMRSAEAFGLINFNIIENPEARFKEANRVTQGTDKWLCTKKFRSTTDCVRALKSEGHKIYVTDLAATTSIDKIDFTHPTAIVFGNEKDGVSQEMKAFADGSFIVPMSGFAQSFNISVAAAVCFYHVYLERMRNGAHADLSEEERTELLAHYALQSVGRSKSVLKRFNQSCDEGPANTPVGTLHSL